MLPVNDLLAAEGSLSIARWVAPGNNEGLPAADVRKAVAEWVSTGKHVRSSFDALGTATRGVAS